MVSKFKNKSTLNIVTIIIVSCIIIFISNKFHITLNCNPTCDGVKDLHNITIRNFSIRFIQLIVVFSAIVSITHQLKLNLITFFTTTGIVATIFLIPLQSFLKDFICGIILISTHQIRLGDNVRVLIGQNWNPNNDDSKTKHYIVITELNYFRLAGYNTETKDLLTVNYSNINALETFLSSRQDTF